MMRSELSGHCHQDIKFTVKTHWLRNNHKVAKIDQYKPHIGKGIIHEFCGPVAFEVLPKSFAGYLDFFPDIWFPFSSNTWLEWLPPEGLRCWREPFLPTNCTGVPFSFWTADALIRFLFPDRQACLPLLFPLLTLLLKTFFLKVPPIPIFLPRGFFGAGSVTIRALFEPESIQMKGNTFLAARRTKFHKESEHYQRNQSTMRDFTYTVFHIGMYETPHTTRRIQIPVTIC